jgi:hypothetical protein
LTKEGLFGALLKTALASELAAMTGSPVSWKRLATPAGRSFYQGLGPAMGGRGRSSLLPTCRAHKGGLPDSHGNTSMWGAVLCGRAGLGLVEISKRLGLPGRNVLAAIYENMMGFPPGWLIGRVKPMATRSSRSSRKPSAAPS